MLAVSVYSIYTVFSYELCSCESVDGMHVAAVEVDSVNNVVNAVAVQ